MSKYESLIDNFEVQTKKIMDFLEIEWNPNIKNFYLKNLRLDGVHLNLKFISSKNPFK